MFTWLVDINIEWLMWNIDTAWWDIDKVDLF